MALGGIYESLSRDLGLVVLDDIIGAGRTIIRGNYEVKPSM